MLVAGGGPAGYASAIALANGGFKNICVAERNATADYYEAPRAFVMALFPHGKDVLRELGLSDIDYAGASRPAANILQAP